MNELEFLPDDYIRARFRKRVGFIRSWLLLAMGLAMVLWSLQMGTWVRGARAELQALRGAESAVEADVSKVMALRAEAQSYNRRFDLLQVLRPPVLATQVIKDVAERLPEDVSLSEISLECPEGPPQARSTVRLAGEAPRETVVTEVMAALEASAMLERAVLVESRPTGRQGDERRSFVIEVGVVPHAAAKER